MFFIQEIRVCINAHISINEYEHFKLRMYPVFKQCKYIERVRKKEREREREREKEREGGVV